MAKKGDVVLVVGRGDRDYVDYWDGEARFDEDEEDRPVYENTVRVGGFY